MATMWTRFGEHPKLRVVLADFFDEVEQDPHLAPKFAGIDIETRIKPHLAKLIMFLLGGLPNYDLQRLREAHAKLGITDEQFSRLIVHLAGVLIKHQVPADIVMHLAVAAQGTRPLIVTAGQPKLGVELYLVDEREGATKGQIHMLHRDVPEQAAFDIAVALRPHLQLGLSANYYREGPRHAKEEAAT